MANSLKTNLSVTKKYEAFYTGGTVQFSQDGAHVFCGCGVVVKVLDVETGTLYQTIGKEEDPEVTCFALSPDDDALVVASQNLLLKQYNWKENVVQRTWKAIHMGPVTSMAFDCTSTLLATGGSDATIKVWDIIRQYCTHNFRGHQGVVRVVAFHPDISRLQLFSGADDYQVRMWDLQNSTCLAVFEGHYSMVTSISFTKEGNFALSSGRDNVVIMWDLENKKKEKVIPVYESVESVIILPEGEVHPSLNVQSEDIHFITAGAKGVLKVWNTRTSQCVYTQNKPEVEVKKEVEDDEAKPNDNAITSAFHVKSANCIAVVTFQHNIIFYSLEEFLLHKQLVGYNDDILDLKYLGNEDRFLAVATNSEQIKFFDTKTWSCQIICGHTDIVMGLDVQKKCNYLASCSKDTSLRIWRIQEDLSITCVGIGLGHTHAVNAVAFSRLGTKFLVSGSEDLTMKLWSLESLGDESEQRMHAKVTEKAHEKDINSICVSPNDKLVASGSQDKSAKLWDAKNLSLLGVFSGHKRGVWCVQFSPVDQALATSSADATIKIWSLTDFSCVKTFEGHEASVLRVSFLSRGMQLISCGSDGLVKLWTIKNNECVKTFDEHEDKIWALAVCENEEHVVTGGADSNIIVWKDTTREDLEEERVKREDIILKEQKLMNFLQQKKYLKAIGLAITLEQPFRVLNILKQILGEPEGDQQLQTTLKKLRMDQIDAVLRFAVEWNTNSKHCHEAQFVVNTVLTHYAPEEILELPNIKSTLEGFLPYTERHFQRMNRLQQQATFVGYTRQCMKFVTFPESSSVEESQSQQPYVLDTSPAKVDSSLEISEENESSSEEMDTNDLPKEENMEIESVEDSGCESDHRIPSKKQDEKISTKMTLLHSKEKRNSFSETADSEIISSHKKDKKKKSVSESVDSDSKVTESKNMNQRPSTKHSSRPRKRLKSTKWMKTR